MEPPERHDDDREFEERLREYQERWDRIADAQTPEELQRALEQTRAPRRSAPWRSALFPLFVISLLMYLGVSTLSDRPGGDSRVESAPEFPAVGSLSTGPFLTVPHASAVAVVPAAGGTPLQVTPLGEGGREPAWRPDGRALLVRVNDGFVEIPVDEPGSLQWALRRPLAGLRGVSPAYSPDGRRVAYVAVLADIVVADRRGGRPRLVADLIDGGEPRELSWSSTDRLAVATGGPIYVVTPRGKVVREVLAALPTAGTPAWSPDGRLLAYTQMNPSPGDGLMRAAIVAPGSRTPPGDRVGPPGTTTAYPAWSPDGRSLAYARFLNGSWDLFVHDVATGGERRLTRGRGDEIDPVWSPDGRTIAFVGSALPSPG